MRVAFVTPFTPSVLADRIPALGQPNAPSGMGGIAVHDVVLGMISRGHEVHVVTLEPGWTDVSTFSGSGVTVHIAPRRPRGSSRTLWREERRAMRDILRDIRPQVVHAHLTNEFALAALDHDATRTLVTAHDMPLPYFYYSRPEYLPRFVASTLVYSRVRWLSGVAPAVIEGARFALRRSARTFVVPNIMPVSVPTSGLAEASTYFITLGEAVRRKNPGAAIRAFELVRARHPQCRLKVVGKGLGPDGPVAAWARKRQLAEGVEFVGQVPRNHVLALLADATACVHPSRSEAHSMTIGEAMGLGVPVVAGRQSGGIPWQLEYGEAGCLVDIENPEDIARGMLRVLEDAAYRSRIVARAHAKLESEWRPGPVLDAYEEIYGEIARTKQIARGSRP